jgi:hypothetical protein
MSGTHSGLDCNHFAVHANDWSAGIFVHKTKNPEIIIQRNELIDDKQQIRNLFGYERISTFLVQIGLVNSFIHDFLEKLVI